MEETTRRQMCEEEEGTISLDSLWAALKKRYWVFLVTTLVVAVGYYVLKTVTFKPIYSTSATFTVSISNSYGSSTKTYNNKTAQQMAKTFPYVLQSGVLSDIVATDLGYSVLPGTISATAAENTNLFTLTVQAAEPQLAYDILCSVIRNYPKVVEFVVGPTTLTLLSEDGVVSDPINAASWPTAFKYGILLGGIVCAAAVALYMLLHRTVSNLDDLKELTNAKCVAVIPHLTQKKHSRSGAGALITQKRISRGFVEAIYRLRTGVEKAGAQVMLVTSSLPGEGKTTVAVNLALALAKKGARVILVDCDLRNSSVHKQLRVPMRLIKAGMSEYLSGRAEMDGLGFTVSNWNNLVVIPGGKTVKNASELLGKDRLRALIEAMREQADFVIVDTPPCTVMADASVAARCVDGVLYVVRQDYASCDRILHGMSDMAASEAPLLGCVLNDAAYSLTQHSYGGYYYGRYGYYGKSSYASGKEG